MQQSLELGYVGVEVADVAPFERYLEGILGLRPGEPTTEGAHTWRIDGKSQRLIVAQGGADDAVYVGFEAADETTFDAAVERLRAYGAEVTAGTDAELAARRVRGMAHTVAPWGTRIEMSWGLADADTPFASELVPGGFVTGGVGLGHTVFFVTGAKENLDEAHRFTTEALGMKLSDYMESEEQGLFVTGNFYHCNGRHHSLALVHVPVPAMPRCLDHIMVETVSEDNVGNAYDRAVKAGVPIFRDLGKHPNDRMFSFYSISPAGFQFEFGTGAVEVDDDWQVVRYDRVSAWGHHTPAPASS